MIAERHRKHKEEIQNYISNRINNERKKYCESLEKYIMKQREEEILKKEKAFKKYQNFVSFKKLYKLKIFNLVFYNER
jgi:hypothetical protein